jgi:single-stranded DNA-binding protein
MNPIAVTVTGTLGADPRSFNLHDGTAGVELRLALDLPPRTSGGREITRWVKVTAYGTLAGCTANSVHKGDRVTVTADDLLAESWISRQPSDDGTPRAGGQVHLRASDIAASMRFDTATTGRAARKAARAAAANGEPNDLEASEQADMKVIAGVTTS